MGSLIHPIAEQARKSAADKDFQKARVQLELGLEQEPGHPDLCCEAGIMAVYRADEEYAFEMLPLSERGPRFEKLISLLADHYTSRILLDRTDHDARTRLQLVRTYHPQESKHIGVKISACLIVRNEEKMLPRCLTSLQGKVDQIVVVDTGSSDATVSIARQAGARVAEFPWCDDFSAARNFALSYAQGNWILWIDADEELTPETKAAFERAVIRPQFGGFEIDIVNFLDDSNQRDQFRHSPTRLFRNVPGVKFSGRIHEQVNPSLAVLNLPWARLEGATILHHGYRPQVMEEKSKLERTISLLEREVKESPSDAFQWFNLANAYLIAGRLGEAANAAERATSSPNMTIGFAVPAFSILIQSLYGMGQYDLALKSADQAEQLGLDCLQIGFERCRVLFAAGLKEEALSASERMMSQTWAPGTAGDVGILTHKRHVLRAQILSSAGRLEEALKLLDDATEVAPDYGPGHFVRGQILESLSRVVQARDAFAAAISDKTTALAALLQVARLEYQLGIVVGAANALFTLWMKDPSDLQRWSLWKEACEAIGNPLEVIRCFEHLAALNQLNSDLAVDWGRAWLAAGNPQQALKCFAEAMKLNPRNANAYFNCGDVLNATHTPDRAAELYRAGLALAPDHADGWFVLGNALAALGREAQAVEAFEKAIELSPTHEKAAHNLGVLTARAA